MPTNKNWFQRAIEKYFIRQNIEEEKNPKKTIERSLSQRTNPHV